MAWHKNDGLYLEPKEVWQKFQKTTCETKPEKICQYNKKILAWERRDEKSGPKLVLTIVDDDTLLYTEEVTDETKSKKRITALIKTKFPEVSKDLWL